MDCARGLGLRREGEPVRILEPGPQLSPGIVAVLNKLDVRSLGLRKERTTSGG